FFSLWACKDPQCVTGSDCNSGYCWGYVPPAPGICCSSACDGPCEEGSTGTCTPVKGAPYIAGACHGDATACPGACDGVDGASWACPGAELMCSGASCDAATGIATLPSFCDGDGSCPAAQTQDCAPLMCGVTQCAGGCSADAECQPAEHCSAGVCVPD